MRYAIITGSGRSGTNWLLDTLDASPTTHCRNEPHGIKGTPLHAFPLVWTSGSAAQTAQYRERWDEVALGTARRFGERDHDVRYPKQHLRPWANHLGMARWIFSPRSRAALARVNHGPAAPEWTLPWWLGSQDRLEDSLGVLKILVDGPLLAWLLEERSEVRVVHAIRHPGGRLHSWLTRLLGPMDEAQRERQRVRRVGQLENVRRSDPQWHETVPPPASLTIVEAELWFWRYLNETTLRAGSSHPNYLMVRFEDLAHNPLTWSRRVFEHMHVQWNDTIEQRVRADTTRSVFGAVDDPKAIAAAWRSKLDIEHLRTLEQVLEGSTLQGLLW